MTLVIGRTPQLAELAWFAQFFSVALAVHVDLSVLVWFLCVGAMGWSLLIARQARPWPYWQGTGFLLTAAGTLLIAASPLGRKVGRHQKQLRAGARQPDLPARAGAAAHRGERGAGAAHRDVPQAASAPLAFLCRSRAGSMRGRWRRSPSPAFFLTAHDMPGGFRPRRAVRYAVLGGRAHPAIRLVRADDGGVAPAPAAAERHRGEDLLGSSSPTRCSAFGGIASFAGFALYPVGTDAFRDHQTGAMIHLLGLAPVLMAVIVVHGLWRYSRAQKARTGRYMLRCRRARLRARAHLLASSCSSPAAGWAGGSAGRTSPSPPITHGEIVGVTLALMGAAYAMLPRFGYPSVAHWRLARWQPVGLRRRPADAYRRLAYSGGYGVLRKTADAATELAPNIKIAMGIMGFGGLLAIVGGLLFVVVMGQGVVAGAQGRPRPRPYKCPVGFFSRRA
ncbi:MAG: hypothetical protein WDN72_09365 [Alphaproteobacteria bacterium]